MVIEFAQQRRSELTRTAGVLILVSIVFWWIALRAWAEAQFGYLDVDALGVAPLVWVTLLAIAGLALVTRVLPRPADVPANVVCIGFFLAVTGTLATVNVAYGAHDGISAAGWLMAAFSVAQATVFVAVMLVASER
ncbi:MAG: hypothetical protein ABI534_10585 [Chloroflexota bacterium]